MTGKEELDTTKEPTPVAAPASESLSRARSKEGRVPPPPPPGELGVDAGMGTGTGGSRGWAMCPETSIAAELSAWRPQLRFLLHLKPAPQPANGTATASSDPQRLG